MSCFVYCFFVNFLFLNTRESVREVQVRPTDSGLKKPVHFQSSTCFREEHTARIARDSKQAK